jgi:hypothetical protein
MLDNQNAPAGGNQPLPDGANDGSLAGAVAAMADIDMDNLVSFDEAANRNEGLPPPQDMQRAREQPRQPDGKFAQQKPGEGLIPNHNQAPAAEQAAVEELSDLDEQFFELPAEQEGGQPQRLSAREVFEGYRERETLRTELERARQVAPPPVEWDRQMYETVQTRSRLVGMLNTLAQTMMPPKPDINLLNEQSNQYSPGEYHRQVMAHQAAMEKVQHLENARAEQQQVLEQEQAALRNAARIREQAKLRDIWPEIRDPAVQRKVVADGARYYGLTTQDFEQTYDARMYALLKDALAYRDSLAQRQSAVKVVRSAPKLVKAQARNTQGRGQQTFATGMQRLQRSGSVEDAADAIGGLLG